MEDVYKGILAISAVCAGLVTWLSWSLFTVGSASTGVYGGTPFPVFVVQQSVGTVNTTLYPVYAILDYAFWFIVLMLIIGQGTVPHHRAKRNRK